MSRLSIKFNDVQGPDRPVPRALRHPFFSWAGLRPVFAQHTSAEHQALLRYVERRLHVVEIGVAEGASAVALRDGMDSAGSLYLIDPYHLSRVRPLNFLRRTAHRTLSGSGKLGPKIYWIEQFSQQAAEEWKAPIDFLMIDGDHAEDAVQRDWEDWHPHVVSGGVVVFHDARLFPSGWTSLGYGPVKFINRVFRQSPPAGWTIIDEIDSLVFVYKDEHLPQNEAAGAAS